MVGLMQEPWKLVLLGGERGRAAHYGMVAESLGIHLEHFSTMQEMGYLGRLREFDAAIVYEDIQPLSGFELAEYIEKLFESLPTVLLSPEIEQVRLQRELPSSVCHSFVAACEPRLVLEKVLETLLLNHKQPKPALKLRQKLS